eukprot:7382852-Prymnesium_polylepis.1
MVPSSSTPDRATTASSRGRHRLQREVLRARNVGLTTRGPVCQGVKTKHGRDMKITQGSVAYVFPTQVSKYRATGGLKSARRYASNPPGGMHRRRRAAEW